MGDESADINATDTAAKIANAKLRLGRAVVQVVGFLIGLTLLVWCGRIAFSADNQRQLTKLAEADWRLVASLFGLSFVVMVISGEVFRLAIKPVKPIGVLSTHATNAISNAMALLPFKLGLVFRVLMHNRRDSVPLLTIGAWFAAISAIMLGVLGPIAIVCLWMHRVDWVSAGTAVGGVIVCCGALYVVATLVATARGWAFVQSMWEAMPLPRSLRLGSPGGDALLARAHEGVRILGSGRTVFSCAALRVLDVICQGLRFAIAARILGIELPTDQAVVAGIVYFLVGALAPFGQLGVRERLTSMLPSAMAESTFALAVLMVTAAEVVVLLSCAVIGAAYLRPDRILRLGRAGATLR